MALWKSRRGISSIFGMLFLAIIIIIGMNAFTLQINQYGNYQRIAADMHGLDQDRISERIIFDYPGVSNFTENSGIYEFDLLVSNTGGRQVKIVRVYIYDYDDNSLTVLDERASGSGCGFNKGVVGIGEQGHEISIRTDEDVSNGHNYSFELVSERGSIFNSPYPMPTQATGHIGIGPAIFTFDYQSFNFTTTEGDPHWAEHSRPAWEMVGGLDDILFWVKITNNADRAIEPSYLSYLEIIVPRDDTSEDEHYFYIVHPNSTSNNVMPYQGYMQSIQPGETVVIKYGAQTPGGISLRDMPNTISSYNSERKYLFTSLITQYWRWAGSEQYYGQFTPFAAIHMIEGIYDFSSGAGYNKWAWGTYTSSFPTGDISPSELNFSLGDALGSWGITSSSFTATSTHNEYRYMGGISPNGDDMNVTKLYIRAGGSGTVAIALYTGGTLDDPTGAVKLTEAYNVPVSVGWNEIDVPDVALPENTVTWIGWCHDTSIYYSSSSSDAGDFQTQRGRYSQSSPSNADETQPMPNSPGAGSFDSYWYAVYAEYEGGEGGTAYYDALAKNDGSHYLNPAPGAGNYSTLIANFTVAKGYWDVDRVEVTWNGRGEISSTDVEMYIWDFDAGDWQLLDSGSGSGDFTLQWSTTTNPENYIDTSNTLTVMIKSQDQDRSTLHDWIEVDIDYK